MVPLLAAAAIVLAPPPKLCAGELLRVGARYERPLTVIADEPRYFRVRLVAPSGRVAFDRTGVPPATWLYRPIMQGGWRLTYSMPQGTATFRFTAVTCGD